MIMKATRVSVVIFSLLYLAHLEAADHLRFAIYVRILTRWHSPGLGRTKRMECFSPGRLSKLDWRDRTSEVMCAERELRLKRHEIVDIDQGVDEWQRSTLLHQSD
jgi:hypothetical protein